MSKQYIIPLILIILFAIVTFFNSIFIYPLCLSFVILGGFCFQKGTVDKSLIDMQIELAALKDKVNGIQFAHKARKQLM